MNEHPDAAWRPKWLQSNDGLEIEAWAVGEKGYKIGSITKRIANRSPEIKEAFLAFLHPLTYAHQPCLRSAASGGARRHSSRDQSRRHKAGDSRIGTRTGQKGLPGRKRAGGCEAASRPAKSFQPGVSEFHDGARVGRVSDYCALKRSVSSTETGSPSISRGSFSLSIPGSAMITSFWLPASSACTPTPWTPGVLSSARLCRSLMASASSLVSLVIPCS